MYKVGNLPDHVTRYNHKCTDRWLTPPVQHGIDLRLMADVFLMGISIVGIIVSGVMILQF